jgi:hypothetical protein
MARQLEEKLVMALAPLVNGRMHPIIIPQKTTLPAIRYATLSAVPDNSLCGSAGLVRSVVQLDIYALDYSVTRALREQVVSAMQDFALENLLQMEQEAYEPDVRAYRRILHYSINEQEGAAT